MCVVPSCAFALRFELDNIVAFARSQVPGVYS